MKWESVAYSLTIFSIVLFFNPYIDRMSNNSWWMNLLLIVGLNVCILFIFSKIKFLQKSLPTKIGWPIIFAVFILIGVVR